MSSAFLNRSLIVLQNCSLSQKWRLLSTCPTLRGGVYKQMGKMVSMEWKDMNERALQGIFMTELARGGDPLFKDHKSFRRNTFYSHILFNRKCKESSNTIRHFHRSCILCDELRTVVVPQLAESLSEGDIRWDKAVGDSVSEDEVIGEIETDKTSVPIHSPAAGIVEELLVADGSTVQPGKPILKLRVGAGGAAVKKEPAKQESAGAAPPKPPPAAKPADVPKSPPPPPPKPSGPKSSTPIDSIKPISLESETSSDSSVGLRKENRVKMNRMRLRIAQRLKDAQNTYAMLTTFNEIDMSNIIEMRNTHKDVFQKKHNLKLGFMSAFVKASAYALIDQPIVNAVIDESEIIYRDYVDISVAVATPKGLVVPVIRNAETMNYADIEKAINALGEKARNNSLAIEDMDGGTFTISNGGVFGSMFGTPIINPPQSAILGMHAIIERPVVINHKIEIRPMMYVCLTYDHRLVDGREAVTFLRKIKAAVEDPRIMLLEI